MGDWLFPLIWLLLTVLFLVMEAVTFNLVSIWFAAGSLSAMIVASQNPDNIVLQVVVFILVSVLSFVLVRRYAIKKLQANSVKTNVNSLLGRKVKVTKRIEPFEYGEVKIDGNYWTAKSYDGTEIAVNTVVEVVEVSGVKVIVKKIDNS